MTREIVNQRGAQEGIEPQQGAVNTVPTQATGERPGLYSNSLLLYLGLAGSAAGIAGAAGLCYFAVQDHEVRPLLTPLAETMEMAETDLFDAKKQFGVVSKDCPSQNFNCEEDPSRLTPDQAQVITNAILRKAEEQKKYDQALERVQKIQGHMENSWKVYDGGVILAGLTLVPGWLRRRKWDKQERNRKLEVMYSKQAQVRGAQERQRISSVVYELMPSQRQLITRVVLQEIARKQRMANRRKRKDAFPTRRHNPKPRNPRG